MDKRSDDQEDIGVSFTFYDLPKVSLNTWYAGTHWSARKRIKDTYKVLINKETKYRELKPCHVEYEFHFKDHPLDCSNCSGMAKLIEDVIFPQDGVAIVKSVKYSSQKSNEDKVIIHIRWI